MIPTSGRCCGMAAGEYDRNYNHKIRTSEVREAGQNSAGPLLVDCVSCREKFTPHAQGLGVRVTDLASLAAEYLRKLTNLTSKPTPEQLPVSRTL